MNVICVQNWCVKMVEHSILAQRYVIAPLGSLGVTVLVRYPAVLFYHGIQDLSNPVSNFPRLADLIVFIRVHWSDLIIAF